MIIRIFFFFSFLLFCLSEETTSCDGTYSKEFLPKTQQELANNLREIFTSESIEDDTNTASKIRCSTYSDCSECCKHLDCLWMKGDNSIFLLQSTSSGSLSSSVNDWIHIVNYMTGNFTLKFQNQPLCVDVNVPNRILIEGEYTTEVSLTNENGSNCFDLHYDITMTKGYYLQCNVPVFTFIITFGSIVLVLLPCCFICCCILLPLFLIILSFSICGGTFVFILMNQLFSKRRKQLIMDPKLLIEDDDEENVVLMEKKQRMSLIFEKERRKTKKILSIQKKKEQEISKKVKEIEKREKQLTKREEREKKELEKRKKEEKEFKKREKEMLQKLKKMKNIQLMENNDKESISEEDSIIAQLNINTDLFKINAEDVQLKKLIGSGGSEASVYRALWTGREVAVKIFRTRLISSENDFEDFEKESHIMGSLSHPNILQSFGLLLKIPRIGIVMEFCAKGDLHRYMMLSQRGKEERFTFSKKLKILKEICSGMSYLHSHKIIHRDLKCLNVLLTTSFDAKIMDFGLSRYMKKQSEGKMTKLRGTSYYLAPEMTLGLDYDEKVDVFSFSIMMYEILFETTTPYGRKDIFSIEMKVANNPSFRPALPPNKENTFLYERFRGEKNLGMYDLYIEIMKKCWNVDPNVRLSFDELLKKFTSIEEDEEIGKKIESFEQKIIEQKKEEEEKEEEKKEEEEDSKKEKANDEEEK